MQKFWNFKNDASERTLFIDGVIASESWFDDEISPKEFKDELISGDGDIKVSINSPGGDCIAAAQIYNMLREYSGKVTVFIDGLAASAASVIAMAGDEVIMSPVAMLMIHNPSSMACGESKDLRKEAEILDEFKESIINAYELKTGLSRTKISHLMDCESWFNAHKALELGFIDSISETEDKEPIDITAAFSNVMVTRQAAANALLAKIKNRNNAPQRNAVGEADFCEAKVLNRTIKADTLLQRLNLLKNWR